MMTPLPLAALLGLLATLAAAQDAPPGDPAKGEADFNRQCVACHVVRDDAGEVLAGRSGRTGPNLFGVIGRVAGSIPDFDYGESMLAYGATGAVWGEANFLAYVQDPTGFLREALQDPGARGKMSYKVRKEEDARDLHAFLATFSPGSPGSPAAPADAAAPADPAAAPAPAEGAAPAPAASN